MRHVDPKRACLDCCPHCLYTAPGGQQGYPGCDPLLLGPHVRCLHFSAYIPMTIDKRRGCDGTFSPEIVAIDVPPTCPQIAQQELFRP